MTGPKRATVQPRQTIGFVLAGVLLLSWGCDGNASLANLPNHSDEIAADTPDASETKSNNSPAPGSTGLGSEENSMTQWKSSSCHTPTQISDYDGKSLLEAHDLLGEPTSTEQFVLAEGTTEFRIGLLNVYSMEKDGQRMIREETWIDDDCRLTLWLAQDDDVWSVKQGLVWPAETEF